MEYRDENKTPRDRIDRDLYKRLYDSDTYGHTERRAYPRTRQSPQRSEPEPSCKAPHPVPLPLAMVYAPSQKWQQLYDLRTALAKGTLFKELDFPFYPTHCSGKESRR